MLDIVMKNKAGWLGYGESEGNTANIILLRRTCQEEGHQESGWTI